MISNRRQFVRAGLAASLGALAAPSRLSAQSGGYRVGVGRGLNSYRTTLRAINACGEWPLLNLQGKTVVIKPNLVIGLPAFAGATTDPGVVRALVDLSLMSGASAVLIVETSPSGAHFADCGYTFFDSYDQYGRVRLADLNLFPMTLAPVSTPLAYEAIYVPSFVLHPDVVFMSVGKLKVHVETLTTLSTKNLFGLPAVDRYISNPGSGRFAMHDRGINQAIVDVALIRPIDFAVVDGMWGMERTGPVWGDPVRMNTVLAGRNSVAVDRVGMVAMGLSQTQALHLTYASRFGLGPASLDDINVSGDPLESRPFSLEMVSPLIEYPRPVRKTFRPSVGEQADFVVWSAEPYLRMFEIVQLTSDSNTQTVVRNLGPYEVGAAGYQLVSWNGRDQNNQLVAPGRYALHVRAYRTDVQVRHADAIGWVTVNA